MVSIVATAITQSESKSLVNCMITAVLSSIYGLRIGMSNGLDQTCMLDTDVLANQMIQRSQFVGVCKLAAKSQSEEMYAYLHVKVDR